MTIIKPQNQPSMEIRHQIDQTAINRISTTHHLKKKGKKKYISQSIDS